MTPYVGNRLSVLHEKITQLFAFILVIYTSELRISTNEGTVPF